MGSFLPGIYIERYGPIVELGTEAIDAFVFDDDWVRFKTGKQAVDRQPVPFEGSVQKKVSDFKDDFSGETLKVDWTWNYPYTEINATLQDGELILTGKPIAGNEHGTALCLRPRTP